MPIMTVGLLDEITPELFYTLYRKRRELPWYAGTLGAYFAETGRNEMAIRVRKNFRRLKRASMAEQEV